MKFFKFKHLFLEEAQIEDPSNRVYKIPSVRMGELQARIDKLNKRFKTGMTGGLELVILGKEIKTIQGTITIHNEKVKGDFEVEFTKCKVTGKPPILEGWKLIAVIDHTSGNIVRVVPGEVLPAKYREADPYNCDHCHVQRRRNESVVVQNVQTKEFKQVGKSCLKDFLGHSDPRRFFDWSESMTALYEMMDHEEEDQSYFEHGGYAGSMGIPLMEFLSYVAMVSRLEGYVSSKAAKAYNEKIGEGEGETGYKRTSADSAIIAMYPYKPDPKDPTPTQGDMDYAQKAFDYVKGVIDAKDPSKLSDYEYNLKTLMSNSNFKWRYTGFVASIIGYYKTMMEKPTYEKKEKKVSEFVGEDGQKMEFTATVLGMYEFETQYGMAKILKFIDEDGNILKWMTSSYPDLDKGDKIRMMATVKGHETYNGEKSTKIVRPKILEVLHREESPANESTSRIGTLLKEAVVQGDLFHDNFGKEDARKNTIMLHIERLEKEIRALERAITDWQTRTYTTNTKPIYDKSGKRVPIEKVNERRRQKNIQERQLRIKDLERQIETLKEEL